MYYDTVLEYVNKLVSLKKNLLSPDEIMQYLQSTIKLGGGNINVNAREVDDWLSQFIFYKTYKPEWPHFIWPNMSEPVSEDQDEIQSFLYKLALI